jgi:hypothetical protein
LSFLVEGALICGQDELPEVDSTTGYVRRAIRGQNLDRAGLSSRHMKLMNLVSTPVSLGQLAKQLSWPEEETQRVIHGFELAELIEPCKLVDTTLVCGLITDTELGQKVGFLFRKNQQEVSGKIVRDWLSLRLLLRRNRPNVLLVELNEEATQLQKLVEESAHLLEGIRIIAIHSAESAADPNEISVTGIDELLEHDCSEQQLLDAILATQSTNNSPSRSNSSGIPATQLQQASASTVSMSTEV